MTDDHASLFEAALADYLVPRGWWRSRCGSCGREYFGKGATACGSPWCPAQQPTREPAGAYIPLERVWSRLRAALLRHGLQPFAMADLATGAVQTDLVVSALQYLDPIVHGGAALVDGPVVLSQPCVRWQFLPEAEAGTGYFSSFVNLSSLQIGPSDLDRRIGGHIDLWLDALSALGIHARRLTIALTDEECAFGPYRGRRADINCEGIEIGEANWYFAVTDARGRDLSVIDFGFAFEKIAWAANPGEDWQSLFCPAPHMAHPPGALFVDRVRTLALASAYDLSPGSRGPRRHVRRLARDLVPYFLAGRGLHSALELATTYWRLFAVPTVGGEQSVRAAFAAIEHEAAAAVSGVLGLPAPPRGNSFAEYCDRIAAEGGERPSIRAAIRRLADVQEAFLPPGAANG